MIAWSSSGCHRNRILRLVQATVLRAPLRLLARHLWLRLSEAAAVRLVGRLARCRAAHTLPGSHRADPPTPLPSPELPPATDITRAHTPPSANLIPMTPRAAPSAHTSTLVVSDPTRFAPPRGPRRSRYPTPIVSPSMPTASLGVTLLLADVADPRASDLTGGAAWQLVRARALAVAAVATDSAIRYWALSFTVSRRLWRVRVVHRRRRRSEIRVAKL